MKVFIRRLYIIYTFILSSLKGSEKEFTSGSINKAILFLSIPMIAEMVMESLFAVVDIFFVSKVGVHAVATVALTESVLMIIYSICVGLSMAATAIVSRRIGEKNAERATNAAVQAIFVGAVVGLVLGIAGFLFAEEILRLMGGDEATIKEGIWYTKIMFGSNISIMLLFIINGAFRGAGDASIAMRSLWLANGLNIILDPILIFGLGTFIPAFGVEGAAIATTIGRTSGVFYQLYNLLSNKSVLKVVWNKILIRKTTILEILKISGGGMGQFLVESASWIFLVRLMSMFGAHALAGYTIAFRVIVFTILPSWGMANAAATLVGQNLGAGSPERAETSVWRTALWNMIFLGIISVLFLIFSVPVVGLFSTEEEVLKVGVSALQIICGGYIFFAYGMVITQAFNGAGDTKTPLFINVFIFWLIQIPMAYLMAVYFDWKYYGVFISIAVCHSLHAIICILLFKKGKWKTVSV